MNHIIVRLRVRLLVGQIWECGSHRGVARDTRTDVTYDLSHYGVGPIMHGRTLTLRPWIYNWHSLHDIQALIVPFNTTSIGCIRLRPPFVAPSRSADTFLSSL